IKSPRNWRERPSEYRLMTPLQDRRSPRTQREWSGLLLDLGRVEDDGADVRHLAGLDLDGQALARVRRVVSVVSTPDNQVLGPRRDAGDLEGPVGLRDSEERVVEDHDPARHPGVDIALEGDGDRVLDQLLLRRTLGWDGEVLVVLGLEAGIVDVVAD